VILCGDRDEPGQRAVRKIGETLLPLAESVRVFSWAALPKQVGDAKDLRELYQTLKNSPSAKP
jgi:DNA primase